MAIRNVIQAGHPALKSPNKTITDFTSEEIKKVLQDLSDTIYKTDLVGIAAPQIAENYMVFVTHPRDTDARKLPKEDIYRVFINPCLVAESNETVMMYEACGSLGSDLFGPVIRPKEVTVEAFDEKGNKFQLTADGMLGRVLQHEIDHLHGIEFIQKVSDYSKIINKKYYVEQIKNAKKTLDVAEITKIEVKNL